MVAQIIGTSSPSDAVFDYRQISLGTVRNIVNQAVAQARVVNDVQELSTIRVGAHDEILRRPDWSRIAYKPRCPNISQERMELLRPFLASLRVIFCLLWLKAAFKYLPRPSNRSMMCL